MIGFVMNRDRSAIQLAIIICTRNRPQFLENLLKSISESIISPKQIVLVSSGIDIKNVVSMHSKNLNLKHIHTEKIGQSNQKVIGIASLNKEIDWVFFLDDDLMLKPDTISKALNRISRINDTKVGGIGARIVPIRVKSPFKSFDQKHTNMKKIGGITKAGRATKYMFDKQIETEWLNGASIWRRDIVNRYGSPGSSSRYAAYEDAIFSFEVAKSGTLLYVPEIQAKYGREDTPTKYSSDIFRAVIYWKIYFVVRNELSLLKCLWSIFGTSLIFMANQQSDERLTARISTVMSIWSKVSRLLFLKEPETKIIEIIESELSAD